MTIKLLMSACLVGQCCRWDGENGTSIVNRRLHLMLNCGEVAVICPEVAGGLDIPRDPSEIESGKNGADVLAGKGHVITIRGKDVSANFVAGAQKALALAKKFNIRVAVLKSGSPSCSCTRIHDGTFSGGYQDGFGVTAQLLSDNGIRVFSEEDLEQAIDMAIAS